jgi:hypothetical protein
MSERRRPLRLVFTLVLSMSLIGAMLASNAIAATANIHIGGGITPGTGARAATPTQVSPGNVAGFYLWIRNDDPANLSSFFMKAFADAGVSPLGAYWSRNGETPPHPCDTSNGLMCSFGALNSGDVIRITAAFRLPTATGQNHDHCLPSGSPDGFGPTGESSWRCIHFQFGANSGFVENKGKNKSRGDAYHWYDYAATDTGTDRGAQFPFCQDPANPTTACTDLLTVFNTQTANRQNVQATQVIAPEGAFNTEFGKSGIAVADGAPFVCPSGIVKENPGDADCISHQGTTGSNKFEGQASDVSVNSEQTFGDDLVHITITMYGVNPNSIDGLVHIWQIGDTWFQRDVTTRCPSAAGPTDATECFWVSGSGQAAVVDVWARNNGKWGNF